MYDLDLIMDKLEAKFDVEVGLYDSDTISIHSSEFDFEMIEFIECEFDLKVKFNYVTDDTTSVHITIIKKTYVDEVYNKIKIHLDESNLVCIDKLHICNRLLNDILGE